MRPDSYSSRFGKIINIHNSIIDNPNLMQKIRKGNDRSIGKNIKVLKEKLPDVRSHDFRHYHATDLFNKGFSDQYAADRLGHDIMVLKKIYQHLMNDNRKREDLKIKELYKNAPGL